MKQKLKTIKFLLTISLAGLLFFGCNAEEETIKNDAYQETIKGNHKRFEDLMKEQKFSNAITKIRKKKSTNPTNNSSKTVMEEQYGFTISDNLVNVLENDSIISYTIAITRENNTPNEFKNLIVQVNNQNEIGAYILKYTSDSEITKDNFDLTTFQGQKTITPIEYNDTQVSSLVANDYFCYMVRGWTCYGPGGHSTSDGCSMGYATGEEICVWTGGGAGGSTTGGTTTTNTSGGGGSGSTINTAPVLPALDDLPSPEDKCQDLATKDNNTDFNAKMANLKTKAATQNVESAYTMFQNATDGLTFSPEMTGNINDENGGAVTLDPDLSATQTATNCIGFMHCHLDNGSTYLVFSFSDFIALANIANISTRPTKEYGVYVTTASGTFAIKVDDKINLKSKLRIMKALSNSYEDKFEANLLKTDSIDTQILGLLNFMKENNFDSLMSLYQKDETTNKWNKLALNTNGTNVVPTTCN